MPFRSIISRRAGLAIALPLLAVSTAFAVNIIAHRGASFDAPENTLASERLAWIQKADAVETDISDIAPKLTRVLAMSGASEKNVTIISFNNESLKAVREQLPRYPTLYLMACEAPNSTAPQATPQPAFDEVIYKATAVAFTGLDLQPTWPLTSADSTKIKNAGFQLHVWTVDDTVVARRRIESGTGLITTNQPGSLRGQWARCSTPVSLSSLP